MRLACLTNGAPKPVTAFVERAGLAPFIDRVISGAEVRRWKPAAIVYRYAADALLALPALAPLNLRSHGICNLDCRFYVSGGRSRRDRYRSSAKR